MKGKFLLSALLTLALMIGSLMTVEAQTNESGLVKPGRFERLMKKNNTVVIDVRTTEEFNSGHIPGALHLDVKQADFSEKIKSLDKSRKYLLYCRSGKRSQTALDTMAGQGFQNVHHLKGGILKWKGALE